ncbi:MAG: M23 family metallopeptidase [Pseudomonadota bacterium]
MLGKLIRYLLLHLAVPAIFLAAGWYGGAKYGAPELLIDAVDGVAARAGAVLAPLLSRGAERGGEIARDAAQEGGDYVVGTVEQMLRDLAEPQEIAEESGDDAAEDTDEETTEEGDEGDDMRLADAGPAPEPAAPPAPSDPAPAAPAPTSVTTDAIMVCGGMTVRNAPRADADGKVADAGATARLNGVSLLLQPATNSCLSSGYGTRGGKLHRGVDYYTKTGGDVLAAGGGVVAEAVTRSDFGNMVVIDHGDGVYTRYAHLARFASGVREGATVSTGQKLGPIGNSGASSIVHLHYEVLTGDISSQAGSFALDSVDPFTLPRG